MINVYNAMSSNEIQEKNLNLEASQLIDTTLGNHSIAKQSSMNLTRKRTKSKIVRHEKLFYPCNSTYTKTNGTTCGLREIMIGRCYHYQYVKQGLFLSSHS